MINFIGEGLVETKIDKKFNIFHNEAMRVQREIDMERLHDERVSGGLSRCCGAKVIEYTWCGDCHEHI